MNKKEDDFLRRLLSTFKVEADEHLKAISSGLLELEKTPAPELVEMIFREAHSLKGAARAVNLTEIETICQSLESVFAALKRQEITLSPAAFDLLHETVTGLSTLLSSTETTRPPSEQSRMRELLQHLERVSKGSPPPPIQEEVEKREHERPPASCAGGFSQPSVVEAKPALVETVRISTTKLDALLLQAEELLSAKLTAGQRVVELRKLISSLAVWEQEWTKIRPDVRTLQQAMERNGQIPLPDDQKHITKLLEFLEWTNSSIRSFETKLTALITSAEHDHRSLGGMVDQLLEDMKQVMMLPFSSLLEIIPRGVRELSRDRGKEVELVIRGGELEIDRRILEEMKDPLLHMVRNCIDHGIEKPEERERKKKPRRGTMTLAISPKNGDKVEILIADDGAGIDIANIRASALKLGIVTPEEAEKFNDDETLSLIFRSGVSTSPIITDISGRGLGLAIVREKVEKLGGVISLETHSDVGTTFRMVLPLTLATFRGVLVRVDEYLFVLPTINVERAVRLTTEEIKTVENRETIPLNGQVLSLVRLGDVLELPQKHVTDDAANTVHIIVLGSAEKRIAFLVDEVLNEQDVLVKPLGKQLSRVRNIAGATVLGTGQVVPILNVPDLMTSAVRVSMAAVKLAGALAEREEVKRKSILVVEDSITARTLVKNILEAAGYEVTTAVDGVDAFTQLRTGEFDIVVSDVDMPRMSGFDLTAKIRSDRKLAELPVVLITALESREDRERGIDVGANAYIVKSSFDQSNLLEVIQKLT